MSRHLTKEPREILVGDILIHSDFSRIYHFLVVGTCTKGVGVETRTVLMLALVWANEAGTYYGCGVGYREQFTFYNSSKVRFKILKPAWRGHCRACSGELFCVGFAVKCVVCDKFYCDI